MQCLKIQETVHKRASRWLRELQACLESERIIPIYYNLGRISLALAIMSIGYDNIVITRLIAEIWRHGIIIKYCWGKKHRGQRIKKKVKNQ